jgi:hypothetical protein
MKHILTFITLTGLTLVALADSYFQFPLAIPKSNEIVAFSNGLQPLEGQRKMLTLEDLKKYIDTGKSKPKTDEWPARVTDFNRNSPCDGVIVDKSGRVIFWTHSTANGLRLETSEGGAAYLEISKWKKPNKAEMATPRKPSD